MACVRYHRMEMSSFATYGHHRQERLPRHLRARQNRTGDDPQRLS